MNDESGTSESQRQLEVARTVLGVMRFRCVSVSIPCAQHPELRQFLQSTTVVFVRFHTFQLQLWLKTEFRCHKKHIKLQVKVWTQM